MKIAVLGLGSIGRRHVRCLLHLGYPDLVLFDPNSEAREAASKQFGIVCCNSGEDVWLAKPEAVLVTTPAPNHVRLARRAVAEGCHIFIEKPLSNSIWGVDELTDEVRRAGVVSMVGCNMRFHPGPKAVRDQIAMGKIGSVLSARFESGSYLPNWRPTQDYRQSISARAESGGGILLEGIHEIDLSLWMFGPGTLEAAALQPAGSLHIDVEGLVELLIRHRSGIISSIHLNFVQRDYRRGCQVIGTDGTLYWDFAHPWVEFRTESAGERIPFDDPWEVDSMYRDELAEFICCARSGKPSSSTVEDGRRALEIALQAQAFDRAEVRS